MTDNEIIKALECCVLNKHICPHTCPMLKSKDCLESLRKYALDLITHQQDEIERLKETVDSFTDIGKLYSEIKTEAYKEFAERVKEKIYTAHFGRGKNEFFVTTINPDDLDNLVKERVGDSK